MKKQAQNVFTDGLVTDYHPLTAKNTTLTDALNATLVTTKGNEMVLQNDVGNQRIPYTNKNGDIEYAQLGKDFIPVGVKEHHGVIYIASYNPTNGLCELGTYPSPNYDAITDEDKVLENKYRPLNNLIQVIGVPTSTIKQEEQILLNKQAELYQNNLEINELSQSDVFSVLYDKRAVPFTHLEESCELVIDYVKGDTPKLVCTLRNYQYEESWHMPCVQDNQGTLYYFDYNEDRYKIEITPPCILTKFYYPESETSESSVDIEYTVSEGSLIADTERIQQRLNELIERNQLLTKEIALLKQKIEELKQTGISYGDKKPFTTEKLNFDLNHPVNIEVQPSYDGSVNLIINDGKNIPRLINSGFSITDSGHWVLPKRYENDDNYYPDNDEFFEIRTSLVKRVYNFPKIKFEGVLNSGNLKVGNYNLYFKYCDDDGNETDFIGESSIISIFKGIDADPFSIDGGVEDMNANKTIKVRLEDLDFAYHYINVYYTRQSAAMDSTRIPQAYKILKKYPIRNAKSQYWCDITITGDESVEQLALSEINTQYFVASSSQTQAQCQNMLFLGNDTAHNPNHSNLMALSQYILPYGIKTLASSKIGKVSPETYKEVNSNFITDDVNHVYPMEYYNTKNIYYNVGYWNEEYYRIGIVYIFNDNTKSPVYNIIGRELSVNGNKPQALSITSTTDDGCSIAYRNYTADHIAKDYVLNEQGQETRDNVFGVIRFNDSDPNNEYLYSIGVVLPEGFSDQLKRFNIKAYFFVRQKRIPTIACQGYTLPWDKEAKVPILTYYGNRVGTLDDSAGIPPNLPDTESMLGKKRRYCVESFLDQIGQEVGQYQLFDSDKKKLIRRVSNTYYKRLHYIPDWAIDAPMFKSGRDYNSTSITESLWSGLHWESLGNVGFYYSESEEDIANVIATEFRNFYIAERQSGLQTPDAISALLKTNYSFDTAHSKYVRNSGSGNIYRFKIVVTDTSPEDKVNPSECFVEEYSRLSISDIETDYYQVDGNQYATEDEIKQYLIELVNDVIENGEGTVHKTITHHTGGTDFTAYFDYTLTKAGAQEIEDPFINMGAVITFNDIITKFIGYFPKVHLLAQAPALKESDFFSFKSRKENAARMILCYYMNGHILTSRGFATDIDNSLEMYSWIIKHYYELYKNCNGKQLTAICPEFEVRQPYFNSLFTGAEFNIRYLRNTLQPGYLGYSKERYYYVKYPDILPKVDTSLQKFKIVSVTDNVPVVAIDKTIYRSVLGSEAEAYRFAYINEEHSPYRLAAYTYANYKDEHDFNLARGIYSPYLGIDAVDKEQFNAEKGIYNQCLLFNIYYNNIENTVKENEKIRFQDNSSYNAISEIFEVDTSNDINLFRGDCFLCTFTHRLNRNFNDPSTPTNDHILDPETWRLNYYPSTEASKDKDKGIERLNQINRGDINAVKMGSWITVKVRSSYNLSIRSLDESHIQESGIMGRARGFYPLQQASPDGGYKIPNSYVINDGFGATLSEKPYETQNDAIFLKNEFQNRIAYSDIAVNDAFLNGYRVFRGTHFRDYTKQYGAIVKLVELQGNLLCVFEHGVALIPINERALAAEGAGGEVYISNANVLPETIKILSDMYGTQWPNTIVKTPYFIYGLDVARKKIWKTNGTQFEVISDFRVEKVLTDNLTIGENDSVPYIGIKNIVTHYNANKSDIMFTFYYKPCVITEDLDLCGNRLGTYTVKIDDSTEDELAWNLCYNEILQKFETFYSWIPLASANIDNQFYSFDREYARELITPQEQPNEHLKPASQQTESVTPDWSPIAENFPESRMTPYIWKHGEINGEFPLPCFWYNEQHPFEFEFVVNETSGIQKIYDNLLIVSNKAEPESFHFTIVGDGYEFHEDKPNMYVRQESTKELLQNLGSNISYNNNYKKLINKGLFKLPKSTIFPLYYRPVNTHNDIYDSYTKMLDSSKSRDYSGLTGSEVSWDESLNEFNITVHQENVPIDTYWKLVTQQEYNEYKNLGYRTKEDKRGDSIFYYVQIPSTRMRGNSQYQEDKWNVQIAPMAFMQKNEYEWDGNKPPIVINSKRWAQDATSNIKPEDLPNTFNVGDIDASEWTYRKQAKIRDKHCKIRVRYSGTKLAIISAIITTFTLSYA